MSKPPEKPESKVSHIDPSLLVHDPRRPDGQAIPTPSQYTEDKWRPATPPRAPIRAIKAKGDLLRTALRNGHELDWADIHERYVDLWQEARLVIWRAKHSKPGVKEWNEKEQKYIQTFIPNDKVVLEAIETTRGVLDSMMKVRREAGNDTAGIPRWAIERIERALRDYPEAQHALLKELAAEGEKQAESE